MLLKLESVFAELFWAAYGFHVTLSMCSVSRLIARLAAQVYKQEKLRRLGSNQRKWSP